MKKNVNEYLIGPIRICKYIRVKRKKSLFFWVWWYRTGWLILRFFSFIWVFFSFSYEILYKSRGHYLSCVSIWKNKNDAIGFYVELEGVLEYSTDFLNLSQA